MLNSSQSWPVLENASIKGGVPTVFCKMLLKSRKRRIGLDRTANEDFALEHLWIKTNLGSIVSIVCVSLKRQTPDLSDKFLWQTFLSLKEKKVGQHFSKDGEQEYLLCWLKPVPHGNRRYCHLYPVICFTNQWLLYMTSCEPNASLRGEWLSRNWKAQQFEKRLIFAIFLLCFGFIRICSGWHPVHDYVNNYRFSLMSFLKIKPIHSVQLSSENQDNGGKLVFVTIEKDYCFAFAW